MLFYKLNIQIYIERYKAVDNVSGSSVSLELPYPRDRSWIFDYDIARHVSARSLAYVREYGDGGYTLGNTATACDADR